jgi:hypothetical protein
MPPPSRVESTDGGVIVGIGEGEAGESQHDMHLFELALLAEIAANIARARPGAALVCGRSAKCALRQIHEIGVLEIAGGGDQHHAAAA